MRPEFSADEYSIMRCYARAGMSRQDLIDDLTHCRPYVTEQATKAMVDEILSKLTTATDEEFSRIDLSDPI